MVYGITDPEDKLHFLNQLIKQCIDRHASLKRRKITRPPAPWLKDPVITVLKVERDILQKSARTKKDDQTWQLFRNARNRLKTSIKAAKRDFTHKILSSKKPKEVWKVIHRILHPNPKRLAFDPNKLNKFFAATAERTLGITNFLVKRMNMRKLKN